jgi:hypothetical protein
MKPHKHAELIKAWADGAEIEWQDKWGEWQPFFLTHSWYEEKNYRIKPKPDYVSTRRVFLKYCDSFGYYAETENNALSGRPNNVRFTFDFETGELKSAEVLK